MDIKRTILIVALAIVSYVMVLKWNQDYGQAALPTQNVASSTTAPGLPDTATGNKASVSDDIPHAANDTSAPAETPVAASTDLIQINPMIYLLLHRIVKVQTDTGDTAYVIVRSVPRPGDTVTVAQHAGIRVMTERR